MHVRHTTESLSAVMHVCAERIFGFICFEIQYQRL